MRETFEPDIVIEDVSYDTFYALLEFLVWTLSQVTRNGDNGYLCICMLRGYQGRWKPGLLLKSWIYAELQGIEDNKRMHPHPDTTSCRLKKIGASGFIPKSEYVFQNNVMKLGTFWSPRFPCYTILYLSSMHLGIYAPQPRRLARFIYTGKLRLSQTQQGDVCFLMGLLRAADQFCVAAAILMADGLIEGWKTDTGFVEIVRKRQLVA